MEQAEGGWPNALSPCASIALRDHIGCFAPAIGLPVAAAEDPGDAGAALPGFLGDVAGAVAAALNSDFHALPERGPWKAGFKPTGLFSCGDADVN